MMRRWLGSNLLRNSALSLLLSNGNNPSKYPERTEKIRNLMLEDMGDFGEKNYGQIVHRIRYAQDPQTLWYARSDVMNVLSAMHGETVARQKVTQINGLFRGLLPSTLTSQPPFTRK